ncbi:hypothetical protein [Candidatus Nitrosotenuis sp. DW1]|uniref:hypothetical protein n=1 Tax=Candidatus Nitrosotenuis sp. DW1 TaxID=2259672 RepID=UPI0015C6DC6F|nr:hypothetical protein [Candidatus Nitrosotenuis sp. DW1]QLH08878.1 hypothetical protein DSQ19_04725 [Candidatus Nitrosotenuis sp. DW1]
MLRLVALVMISALLSTAMISAISSGHFAEAAKATKDSKSLRHKYSNWVGNKVCGDELCPGPSYFKWHMKYRTHTSPYDTYGHQELLKVNKQK